jgi:hypothetical protein
MLRNEIAKQLFNPTIPNPDFSQAWLRERANLEDKNKKIEETNN